MKGLRAGTFSRPQGPTCLAIIGCKVKGLGFMTEMLDRVTTVAASKGLVKEKDHTYCKLPTQLASMAGVTYGN